MVLAFIETVDKLLEKRLLEKRRVDFTIIDETGFDRMSWQSDDGNGDSQEY